MTDAKAIRFGAVLVVLAGYAFVFRAGEARIDEQLVRNAQTLEQLRADERTTASVAALESKRHRLLEQLRRSDIGGERSLVVARFLRDAGTAARARRTTITAVTAGGAQPVNAASAQRATAGRVENGSRASAGVAFDGVPLELTVEGRYADVLSMVRALSAGRVPATVDVSSLARKNPGAPDATLTAALRLVLEPVMLDPMPVPEPNDVPRQPS
jgi:hypothetical protein